MHRTLSCYLQHVLWVCVSGLLGRGRKLCCKASEVRKLITGIRISLMCSDFIRLCWLYTGKVIQPLFISAIWADLVFVFIPPLLQWQGIKPLRQITGVFHQPLMKRFCLHVWVHLIRTSKSKKSSNPPMTINPSCDFCCGYFVFIWGINFLFSQI